MPLKDDLFQRTLDKLSEITKALLNVSQNTNLDEAEQAIQEAYVKHLASTGDVLRQLPTEQLLAVLSSAGSVDKEKAYLLASIFYAEIELEKVKTKEVNTAKQLKALDLFLESAIDDVDATDIHERIAALNKDLSDFVLPEKTHWRFFDYAQYTGRFADAEDKLFDLVADYGASETAKQKGSAFYERLLNLKDKELETGNLPREEVLEGKLEFETQLTAS